MRSSAIGYGRKVWQRRRTAASGSGRSTACRTRARPGSDPVSVRNGRLDRERLSDLARVEPEARADNRRPPDIPHAYCNAKRSIRRSLASSYRESATLDMDQRSGREGGHDPAGHHPREDRERDMSQDTKPAQKRIDQFLNGPGGRPDDWRDLMEGAKVWARGGDRGDYDAALADLSVTEEFHGYPGLHLMAALREAAVAGDAGTSLSLGPRVPRGLTA